MKIVQIITTLIFLNGIFTQIVLAESNCLADIEGKPTDSNCNYQSQKSQLDIQTENLLSVQPITDIPKLSEIQSPITNANLLVEPISVTTVIAQTNSTSETETPNTPAQTSPVNEEEETIEIIIEGKQDFSLPSNPVYKIFAPEIEKLGADSAAEILRTQPGFAINDFGFGADIHTGTYYRGQSINQSVFLINGRSINTNINIYHGTTDLNSLPVDAIDEVELSSGTSATLYGSEAIGGVVNIITKKGSEEQTANAWIQYGSFDQSNYRVNYGNAIDNFRFKLGYERFNAENRYRVPKESVNRDAEGRLFNGDTATSNYFGNLSFDVNPRNTLSLDAYVISSRRGLLYFGFPLQRDRLNHDAFNIGLSWQTLLGNGEDSILKTTIGYNKDYFNTYGPTQNIFFRTGALNSQAITARIDHDWQVTKNNNLRWGVDFQNNFLNGDVLSTAPNRLALNETENRDRTNTALFALNTWKITQEFQTEFGLRQNFNSEFGSYLNPSVGLRWQLIPTVAMRGSWVSVQRNPGLDQLYVYDTVHNWLPNPDLKPETGSSWSAGFDVNLAQNLTGQFTYFGSSLNDRLGIEANRWTNIGLVNTNGFEAALRWKFAPQFSTFLNYTYTDARIETGAEKGLQLALVPFSVGQLGIGYESGGWQLNLLTSYSSGARRAFFNNPGDTNRDFSPSWVNLDLTGRIPLSRNLGLTFYLENLAGVQYEKVNRIYHPGFTFRVGLQSNL